MHFCRYFHDHDLLPSDIRETLEGDIFTAFYGSESGDAEEGQESVSLGRESTASAAPPLRTIVQRLINTAGFDVYTSGNRTLSERLAHDAIEWCGNQWSQVNAADPYGAELSSLQVARKEFTTWRNRKTSHHSPDAPVLDLAEMRRLVEQRPGLRRVVEDLEQQSPSPETLAGPGKDEWTRVITTARTARVLDEWERHLGRDREHHQNRILGRALGGFVREMHELLPRLNRQQELVRDLFGTDDPLWDLSSGQWEELPLDGLEEASQFIGEHEELRRLAEILGRSRVVTEERTRTAVESTAIRELQGIGKSEVTGIAFGDDLTSLIPSEASLLSDPDTTDLFFAKLAHKELLVLGYNRERLVEHTKVRTVNIVEKVTLPRGPIILCIDTSGSMMGFPEKVAKAITLALSNQVLGNGRAMELIAFSTEAERFRVVPGEAYLPDLARFLSGGFHGGTDLRPALAAALATLEEEKFALADVLVISDFRVPKIADRFIEQIKDQQRRGTLFHSLTIARGSVVDPLNIFDHSWLFDTRTDEIDTATLRFIQ